MVEIPWTIARKRTKKKFAKPQRLIKGGPQNIDVGNLFSGLGSANATPSGATAWSSGVSAGPSGVTARPSAATA